MGLNPFLTFYIYAMLNFDGDVDANTNANIKCEHTIRFNTVSVKAIVYDASGIYDKCMIV